MPAEKKPFDSFGKGQLKTLDFKHAPEPSQILKDAPTASPTTHTRPYLMQVLRPRTPKQIAHHHILFKMQGQGREILVTTAEVGEGKK